jgi:hypothetical protein
MAKTCWLPDSVGSGIHLSMDKMVWSGNWDELAIETESSSSAYLKMTDDIWWHLQLHVSNIPRLMNQIQDHGNLNHLFTQRGFAPNRWSTRPTCSLLVASTAMPWCEVRKHKGFTMDRWICPSSLFCPFREGPNMEDPKRWASPWKTWLIVICGWLWGPPWLGKPLTKQIPLF